MTLIDAVVLIIYFIVVLAIGIYHHRKNESEEDYYVADAKWEAFISASRSSLPMWVGDFPSDLAGWVL